MKKVKAVTRRKSALVLILLGLMMFILAPWVNVPSRTSVPAPVAKGESVATPAPDAPEAVSHLRVEAALQDSEFQLLVRQNNDFLNRNTNIVVELIQVSPDEAYRRFTDSSRLEEAADVMLMSNEWVKEFAVSGYLLPADTALAGAAQTEQFDAVADPLKWNGYIWGVPRDFDPYVIVWNSSLVRSWLGEDVIFPLTFEHWALLAAKSAEEQSTAAWLTLNPDDPLALLAWLDNSAGQRSDGLIAAGYGQWKDGIFDTALGLLDQYRAGVSIEADPNSIIQSVAEGRTAAAVLPHAAAVRLSEESPVDAALEIDRSSWKLPFVWPRGRSYVISSHTAVEEAAHSWIAAMTDGSIQIENREQQGLLPVYRSIYGNDAELFTLFRSGAQRMFPEQPPQLTGPELPARLAHMAEGWAAFAQGRLTLEDWKKQWLPSSTDF